MALNKHLKNKDCQSLALGTAQLGMPYGVANVAGQPDYETVEEIVAAVWGCGVRFFDTAPAYGRSEEALGRAFTRLSLGDQVCVISKLTIDQKATKEVCEDIESSLARLKVPRLWGGLLHREEELDRWNGSLHRTLSEAKRAGLLSYIGASVYSVARALQALDLDDIDLIQVPANVFDRRMERAGVFEHARERGKVVFVRSVYLQGLALMETDHVGETIPCGKKAVAAFKRFCAEHQVDRQHFAIDYVRRMAPDAKLIIGAETTSQARENCALFARKQIAEGACRAWTSCWPDDVDELVDPRRWPPSN